jgi:acetylornithine deacetylase/succinyl-diaminopimelate desuccinylase-like protein
MAAIFVSNLIRLKAEGFRPARDIIVALTADEEGGDHNGVAWLLQTHRELIDAEFCINEGGDGVSRNGRRAYQDVQAAEKVYQSFKLESTNPGGHSSLPSKDNAIYHLAGALVRISQFDFPVQVNEVTRRFFERTATLEQGETAQDMLGVAAERPDPGASARLSATLPFYNAQLRTTCVATLLDGGHAENALPQKARATVNCRMLPGSDPAQVQQTLVGVIDDPKVSVAPVAQSRPSAPSPLRPDVIGGIEQITEEMWPGVLTIPTMSTGATDGLWLRNAGIPTYGVSGVFFDINDNTSHGRDERVGVSDFFAGLEFQYRLAKRLAALPETR